MLRARGSEPSVALEGGIAAARRESVEMHSLRIRQRIDEASDSGNS